MDKKYNSLNTIRMLAAINVMYGHINGHLDIKMPRLISMIVGGGISWRADFLYVKWISCMVFNRTV